MLNHDGITLDSDGLCWIIMDYVYDLMLVEEILNRLMGSLSHDVWGFIHPRWLAAFLPSTVAMSVLVVSHALLHSILRVDSRDSVPYNKEDVLNHVQITPPKFSIEPEMMVWKMSFLFQGCILRFPVKLQGCNCNFLTYRAERKGIPPLKEQVTGSHRFP